MNVLSAHAHFCLQYEQSLTHDWPGDVAAVGVAAPLCMTAAVAMHPALADARTGADLIALAREVRSYVDAGIPGFGDAEMDAAVLGVLRALEAEYGAEAEAAEAEAEAAEAN